MDLQFRHHPGCRERHLKRRADNPLFPAKMRDCSEADLNQARHLDDAELIDFMQQVQALVKRIVALDKNVDSDVILELKAKADQYYEQCTGLPGDQQQVKSALISLVDTMMQAIDKSANNDRKALDELEQEKVARDMHYSLLEYPLTGDLLRAQSPINANELVPTLLSEPHGSLNTILDLFEREQLAAICKDARLLIEQRREEGFELPEAEQTLQTIEAYTQAKECPPD